MKNPMPWKSTLFAGSTAAGLLFASAALAGPVVDQSQYSFDLGAPVNTLVGQSFTAGLNGLLTDITVASDGQIESSGTLTLKVLSGDGTGGAVLGTVTQAYGPNSYDPSLNIFALNVDVAPMGIDVTDGSQYTFLFTNVTGSDFPGRGVNLSDRNPYAGGRAYDTSYGNFASGWDLVFDTEVNQNVPDSGTTAALIGVALLSLAALRRRYAR
jgi:hypothetical protein